MTNVKQICSKCNVNLQSYWLKDGICYGCRNPDSIVTAQINPKCQMTQDCANTVTHIDDSGFIYCQHHGNTRKQYRRCRKLKPSELKLIRSSKPITRY